MAFYSNEEFKAQVEDCIADGMTYLQAYQTVVEREREDEARYIQWLSEQQLADIEDNFYDDEYSY